MHFLFFSSTVREKVGFSLSIQKKKKTQRLCKLMVAGRRVGEGIVGEFGMHMSTLLYLKWVTNKDLL